ncbi:MAG: orange carotenoid protein N-terminal domain-containing protein [Cyanobacteriota bacterium]|nr:orange carotenoid protein N-terminal domain-containing protein [Cyanobacteriota bacterium]
MDSTKTQAPVANSDLFQKYSELSTDEKLALLYYVYEKMGNSVTPAAPGAAEPTLIPDILGKDYLEMSDDKQLAIMREVTNGDDTEASRAYGGMTPNNQVLVWYAWAEGMGNNIVDMPKKYDRSDALKSVLSQIEGMEYQQQISLLREACSQMGYSEVGSVQSQEETGKTPSL